MSNYFDFPFHIEESWKLTITARDGNGTVIDLTGATIRFRVATSSAVVLTAEIGTGITVASDPTTGVATVNITKTMQDDASVTLGTYRWEYIVITASGIRSVQARGQIMVVPSLYQEFA